MSVDVLNETDFELDELELVALSKYVMAQMHVHPGADLCLRLVDEAAMRSSTCSGWTCRGRPT